MAKRVGAQEDQPFVKLFRTLSPKYSPWEVWKDFTVTAACAISNAVDPSHFEEREALYMRTIKKYTREELEVFPRLLAETTMALEANPKQDYLGNIFMALELGNDAGGQFFTPYHVCEVMAKVTLGDVTPAIRDRGYVSINDPACGAGATLIAGVNEVARTFKGNWQNHVLVTGQDIDYTVSLMCYIQLSLLGVAGYIKIGNTLTEPMCSNDTLDSYWLTPMYCSSVWAVRRLFKGNLLF